MKLSEVSREQRKDKGIVKTFTHVPQGKYIPHQGKKEIARRAKQEEPV